MADIRAAQSGDFSATSTWIGGVIPGSGDVAYANSFTVTVSDTRTVQAVSNAAAGSPTATVGGTFSLVNGCNLTCSNVNGVVQGGTATACVTTTSLTLGASASIAANIAQANASATSILFSTAGTLNTIGNFTSGTLVNAATITINGSGTLNHTGNITGGASGFNVAAFSGSGVANITGNVTAGPTNTSSIAINMSSSVVVTITGNVTANAAPAIVNNSSGSLTINGTCQSSATQPAIGAGSASQITRLSGPFLLGATGNINPVQAQSWRWAPTQIPTYMEVPTSGGSTKRNLYTADNMPSGGYPTVANVRQSTIYGPSSEFTGTLAVPAASSVALGVAVDNTTGTAILTAANVRAAVGLVSPNLDTKLDTAAADSSGVTTLLNRLTATRADYLDNIATAAPTAAAIASAVWAAASRTLTQTIPTAAEIAAAVWGATTRTLSAAIDNSSTIAAAVWSYVSGRTVTGGTVDTLTNAPSVPSAATIASQVRTELATELARLDAAVSTRLAAAAYSAAPTTAAIRTELSVELARLDAAVSTRLAPSGTLARVTLVDTTTTVTNSSGSAPSAATVAAAVRSELTPELARVANCATTDTTATTIQDALSS